jgi:hypothetical protein
MLHARPKCVALSLLCGPATPQLMLVKLSRQPALWELMVPLVRWAALLLVTSIGICLHLPS